MNLPAKILYLLLISVASAQSLAEILHWENGESFRRAPVVVPPSGHAGFTLLSSTETGVSFTNNLALQRMLANQNLMNGSGVAFGDFDNDGLCDFYLCNENGTNALFKNLGGWKFTNVTEEAGVTCFGQVCSAAVFADINGDGWLDLLVSSMGGPNACFVNLGNGKFTNVTAQSGISSRLGGMSMALADIDGDGTLDLYIANYGATSLVRSGGGLNVTYENGIPIVKGRYAQRIKIIGTQMFELGEPDAIYLNDGRGNFKMLSWTDGTFLDEYGNPLKEAPLDQGLSVIFHDINGDGAPDIYVCNDFLSPDRCWINDGRGHFKVLSSLAWRSTCYFSMGVDFGDLNRDGYDDFFVLDMLSRHHGYRVTQKGHMPPQPRIPGDLTTQLQLRRNTLFQNRGDGTFAEIAFYAGIAGSEWSWCGPFIDVDLDGWEDILVVNGFPYNQEDVDTKAKIKALGALSVEDARRAVTNYPPLKVANMAFRNNHNMTFTDVSQDWSFNSTEISNGIAFADLDNDGDLDLIVNSFLGPTLVYRNDTDAPRIAVRLKGKTPNTQGIGARLKVLGGPVTQTQEVMSGGRYVSGDDPMRVFACGSLTNHLRIEVTWRNGNVSVVDNAIPNSIYEIDEAGAKPAETKARPVPLPLFRDVSQSIQHKHADPLFDDFQVQGSLPNRLSQMGPGVSWCDVDGDGLDDLIIGAGKGDEPAILRNTGNCAFQRIKPFAAGKEETSAALGYRNEVGDFSLLFGINNFEGRSGKNLLDFRFRSDSQSAPEIFPGNEVTGPLAITELDHKLTLFVGGRFAPGRYPEPAASFIYRLENGRWKKDQLLSAALSTAGLVSGAVWTDLDQDGTAELVLACEWGPIRVFQYKAGKFSESTDEWGLNQNIGWWQSVTAADVDGDGRMDLIAGNRGLNSSYNQAADHQVELFYGDINGTGAVEMIEAYFDAELKKTVPWRDMTVLSQSFPWLPEKYRSHKEYAAASVEEMLSGRMQRVKRIKTTTLANIVFLNRGGKFEARELPGEAQYAPAFGISATDFDGDGHIDLFLAQNFFAVREDDSRMDAGRGLLLRGKGSGEFEIVSGEESGIKVYGEQRGCAISDFDGDGRVDLVVTQNANSTKLYRNERGLPGLRVRIKGPAENREGAGAQLRLGDGKMWGPVAEVHLGSGYWSQDSAVQVLSRTPGEQKLAVLWPGGKRFEKSIPANAAEVEIDEGGAVTRVR